MSLNEVEIKTFILVFDLRTLKKFAVAVLRDFGLQLANVDQFQNELFEQVMSEVDVLDELIHVRDRGFSVNLILKKNFICCIS